MWLNEGIATVTVDRFLERPTIRQETLELLETYLPKAEPPTYRALSRMPGEAIAYHATRGYWLVRYLEEAQPGFLNRIFSRPPKGMTMDNQLALELRMEPEGFWTEIDKVVWDYFEGGSGSL